MKKYFKKLIPVFAAVLLVVSGSVVEEKCSCANDIVPFAVVFSLFGCSSPNQTPAVDGKQNVQTAPTASVSAAKITFMELGSEDCMPCRAMKPVLKSIEKKYAGKVNVVYHDVWTPEGEPYAKKYGISAIPTQIFLDADGKEFFRHTGFYPEEAITKLLDSRGIKP